MPDEVKIMEQNSFSLLIEELKIFEQLDQDLQLFVTAQTPREPKMWYD